MLPWLDVGTSAGLHYLVWPFAEGETLETAVQRDGLLPPARAALIGVQLAQVLQWCERHQIWHGAIKPSNVMLSPDGQARLLDFGIGVLLAGAEEESMVNSMAESGGLAAQVDCTAPECIIEPEKRSVRGDQYSLGCTLYYGLTGRYPFPDGTTTEKMLSHQREQATPVSVLNPGVPNALAAAIERLMEKAPEARYNHTDELVAALSPLARQSAIYVPPPTTPPFLQPRNARLTPARFSASLLSAASERLSSPELAPRAAQPAPPPPRPSSDESSIMPAVLPARDSRPSAPKISPETLPATPPPRLSLLERLKQKLLFWKSWTDPVACTLLTPSGMMPGETSNIQVVLHHSDRSAQARTLPDWRGTQDVPERLGRGESVGMQLRLQGVEVPKALATIEWNGYSAAALFTVRVPPDWPGGQPVQGSLIVGRHQRPIGTIDFTVRIAAAQPA